MGEYECKKMKLSEIMQRFEGEELIFSAVGPHTGDDFSETMKKKLEDMGNCEFCLWAITTPISEYIKEWCDGYTGERYVVLVEGQNKDTKNGYHAVSYNELIIDDKGEILKQPHVDLPKNMKEVTGASGSYAYYVKDIIEIIDDPDDYFTRNDYLEISPSQIRKLNQIKRYPHPKNKKAPDSKGRKVKYVLVLESPFIVKLNMAKD